MKSSKNITTPPGEINSMLINSTKLFRIGFWLCCFVVALLSLVPSESLTLPIFLWWDKAQHALAYTLLGSLGLLGYPDNRSWVLLLGLILFGLVIELAQAASGWRTGDPSDLLADVVGLVCSYILVKLFGPGNR